MELDSFSCLLTKIRSKPLDIEGVRRASYSCGLDSVVFVHGGRTAVNKSKVETTYYVIIQQNANTNSCPNTLMFI